mgnify:CR=1 FL=1
MEVTENDEGEDDPDGIRSQLGWNEAEIAVNEKEERVERKT